MVNMTAFNHDYQDEEDRAYMERLSEQRQEYYSLKVDDSDRSVHIRVHNVPASHTIAHVPWFFDYEDATKAAREKAANLGYSIVDETFPF